MRHNPYFSRWFSAILKHIPYENLRQSHNPYFSRWFSAIGNIWGRGLNTKKVTILILVDGFLQYKLRKIKKYMI